MNTTSLDLSRWKRRKAFGHTGRTVGLLKTLGVPNRMLYVRRLRENGSFWLRQINHLQVLEQARWLYRKQIACVHPDRAGGSLERTIQLNDTWGKIERRFKEHGHSLW
jgi:hypothetical protein